MTQERWHTIPPREQLLHIGAAINRASHWQEKNEKNFNRALAEAQELAKLSLHDPRWNEVKQQIEWLNDELQQFMNHNRTENIAELYKKL